MKLAYLMNAYPMTSTTFIRREIQAHEDAGFNINRYAIRTWDQPLVDPKDIEEKQGTYYILQQSKFSILAAFIREFFTNPLGFARGFGMAFKLMRAARGKRLLQFAYLLEAIVLKQKTVRDNIDHLHTHFSTNSASVALLSYKMGGPRYSMTVHGPDELFEMKENSLFEKVRNSTFVAAISDCCKSIVDKETLGQFSDKVHVVRCGLDLSEFKDYDEVPNNKNLICIGRLCKAKAQKLLVEAVGDLKSKHRDLRLTLIGDGEDRAALEEQIIKLELQDYVKIAGWQTNEEVRQSLRNSRAMVLPSLAEGLPIVIMESFAQGRPVVTTEIYGIPELVDGSCGWLAHPGDVASLRECVDGALSAEPERLTAMAEVGRKRVHEMHDQRKSSDVIRSLVETN